MKTKRLLAFILTLVMVCVASGTVAYADSGFGTASGSGSGTRMWSSGTYTVPANSSVNTGTFYLSDPYFAFEMRATTTSGGTNSGTYNVQLKYSTGATKLSATESINGITYKYDWIDIVPYNYYFTITNNSNVAISVSLVYYSWS